MKPSNDSCAPTSSLRTTRRMPGHGPGHTLGTMLRPVLALCTLTALAFGCHSGEPAQGPADLDSARAGWRSTELVMAEAGIDVQGSSSVTIDENGVSTMVAGSMSCPEGGSVTVDVDAQTSEELVASSVVLDLDGCGVDGVVLDGHLEIASEVTDAEVSSSIIGDLTFSGAAQGTCEIDIGTTVTHDASSSSVSSHASVCGFGYDQLLG